MADSSLDRVKSRIQAKAAEAKVVADEAPLTAGDVVELKSGSFAMTILRIMPAFWSGDSTIEACCAWDLNGVQSGKSCRVMERKLPLSSLKRWVHPENRDIPF